MSASIQHHFNELMTIRPELAYYNSYNTRAFDNGTRFNQVMFSCDMILRF